MLTKVLLLCILPVVYCNAPNAIDWLKEQQQTGTNHIYTIPLKPQSTASKPPATQQDTTTTTSTPPPNAKDGDNNNAEPPQDGDNNNVDPPQDGDNNNVEPPQDGDNNNVDPPQDGDNNNVDPPQAGGNKPKPKEGDIKKPMPGGDGEPKPPKGAGGSNPKLPKASGPTEKIPVVQSTPQDDNPPPVIGLETLKSDSVTKFRQSLRVFASILYSKILKSTPPGENILFSPASISHAMGMLISGSAGNTSTQLKEGLQLDPNMRDIDIDALFNHVTKDKFAEVQHNDVKVMMASKGYFQVNFPVKGTYLNNLRRYYHAGTEGLDFTNVEQAAKLINTWVEEQTNSLIKDLVAPEHFSDLTRFVLVNALYFKAPWLRGFTMWDRPMTFATPSGSIKTPFMWAKTIFKRMSTEKYEYIGIPYKDEKTYFFIIMPKNPKAMENFERENSMQNYFKSLRFHIVKRWKDEKIYLYLPKFTTEMSVDVKKILPEMGVTDIFSSMDADLSRISDEFVYVSDFLHKAKITVNKDGTEAAAASAVISSGRSLDRVDTVFIDKPFIYGVFEEDGDILFMGKIVNPSNK